MKRHGIYPGISLISIGGYFLLQHYAFPFASQILRWPTLFVIIGIAFLLQAYIGREFSLLFPGSLLTGFGIHFHAIDFISDWPNHLGVFSLIIGLSFLLLYSKTRKEGLASGLIFLILSLPMFTSLNLFSYLDQLSSFLGTLWPIFLIILGVFFIVKRK